MDEILLFDPGLTSQLESTGGMGNQIRGKTELPDLCRAVGVRVRQCARAQHEKFLASVRGFRRWAALGFVLVAGQH